MKAVYETMAVTDAEFIAMMIRDEGIDCFIQHSGANLMTEMLPIFPARVEVRDEDVERAMVVVKRGIDLLKSKGAPPDDDDLDRLAENTPRDPEV